MFRLLEKAGQPFVAIDLQDAKAIRFFGWHFDGGERDPGFSVAMESQHLRVIHLVDVIA